MDKCSMSDYEKAYNYRKMARSLLKLHDEGQNLLISGKLTYKQYSERSEFYQLNIMKYKKLEEVHRIKAEEADRKENFKGVTYNPTWREFLNAFHKNGRHCTFSHKALVAIYVCLEEANWYGEEHHAPFILDVDYITQEWNEYDSIADVAHAHVEHEHSLVSLENLRSYVMVSSNLEEFRLRAEVIELKDGGLVARYY